MLVKKLGSRTDFVLRLTRGEDVIPALTTFCINEQIVSGSFRAIGAIENAKVGYYNLADKKYGSRMYPDAMEVASMVGNIALVEGAPFVHVHVVLTGIEEGSENQAIGGHLFGAIVAVTLEVHLETFSEPLERAMDEKIGLKLLALDGSAHESTSSSSKMVE